MDAKFIIGRAKRIPGGVDDDGYSTEPGFGDPEAVKVFGWQPMSVEMPVGADLTERIIRTKRLLLPSSTDWVEGDRVWLAGAADGNGGFTPVDETAHLTVTSVEDYNTGPFGYSPGASALIERITG